MRAVLSTKGIDMMKIGILAALVVAAIFFLRESQDSPIEDTHRVGSTVRLMAGDGHGSATHIGSGYLLTAAHVAENSDDGVMRVKFDDGSITTADVLWYNEAYDVALMRLKKFDGVQVSSVSCRVPTQGETVIARGNPLMFEFTSMVGHVSSGIAKTIGRWRSAVPVDAVVLPGMSGGGLFDSAGSLIAINVGTLTMGPFGALTGVGVVVPASVACELMGPRIAGLL